MLANDVRRGAAYRLLTEVRASGRTIPGGTEVVVTEAPAEGEGIEAVTVCAGDQRPGEDVDFETSPANLEPIGKVGTILGPRAMLMRMEIGSGKDQCGHEYEVGVAFHGGVYVYSRALGRYWQLGLEELISLAKDNGLDTVEPGIGSRGKEGDE